MRPFICCLFFLVLHQTAKAQSSDSLVLCDNSQLLLDNKYLNRFLEKVFREEQELIACCYPSGYVELELIVLKDGTVKKIHLKAISSQPEKDAALCELDYLENHTVDRWLDPNTTPMECNQHVFYKFPVRF
ncbi:MAG: hypothetical protein V4638_00705 [Bacteroidota bacterium]